MIFHGNQQKQGEKWIKHQTGATIMGVEGYRMDLGVSNILGYAKTITSGNYVKMTRGSKQTNGG